MNVDPGSSVLVGTYATERMGEIIASALNQEGIPAVIVHTRHEGLYPPLDLIRGAVGVFVSRQSADRARKIVRLIEDPEAAV